MYRSIKSMLRFVVSTKTHLSLCTFFHDRFFIQSKRILENGVLLMPKADGKTHADKPIEQHTMEKRVKQLLINCPDGSSYIAYELPRQHNSASAILSRPLRRYMYEILEICIRFVHILLQMLFRFPGTETTQYTRTNTHISELARLKSVKFQWKRKSRTLSHGNFIWFWHRTFQINNLLINFNVTRCLLSFVQIIQK